jgi:hypothetical protein
MIIYPNEMRKGVWGQFCYLQSWISVPQICLIYLTRNPQSTIRK